MFKIATTVEFTDEDIAYILSAAFEGGSNHWARSDGQPYDTGVFLSNLEKKYE